MKRLLCLALLLCARLPAADMVTLLPTGAAGRLQVPTQAMPMPTNWTDRLFDDHPWTPVVTPVGFDAPPPPVQVTTVIADSVTGFSAVQGSNGWSYGFYNRGADANQSYDPNSEFVSADPHFGFLNGAWQLGTSGGLGINPPWDFIGPLDMHPNQSGGEHWAIRRYTSATAGRVRIAGMLGNLSGLGSTVARLFVDGIPVYTATVGGQGFGYSLLITVDVGSKVDFALDPNGSDASDATRWTATLHPATDGAALTADSMADFSGVQGAGNWFYGFYNRTGDADGEYTPATDFVTTAPDWSFTGGQWTMGPDDPPWDTLAANIVHPNGINDGEEHWVIRRWVSPFNGPVTVDWHFAKEAPYGEGASLLLLHNGSIKDSLTVAGDDRLGAMRSVVMEVRTGDTLDFACTPVGPEGDDGDGADRCVFRAVLFRNTVYSGAVCTPVADSRADWNTNGQQGFRGWTYGYYNKTADATPGYQAADFIPFPREGTTWSRSNFWRGVDWDWNPDLTPWDNLGQIAATPNGTNTGAEHWVIRRWVSSVSGRVRVTWFTRKSSPFGTGVTGKLLHNGVERDAASISAGDFTGFNRSLDLIGVAVGDTIDLALTPVGPGGSVDGNGDGSLNGMSLATALALTDAITTDIADSMRSVSAMACLRVPFHVADTSRLETISLSMRYDDGFVAWLNGVEIARRNMVGVTESGGNALTQPVECRATAQALTEEWIDGTAFRHVLVNGTNVLAVQGWNCRADDADFLLAPVLTATLMTNAAPHAGADGLATLAGQPATVSAAELLANDSDPDGDLLSVSAVDSASVAGGTILLANGGVTYTPPPGFAGLDTFSYTAVDGRGKSATGSVQVLVVTGSLPVPGHVVLDTIPSGIRLRFAGTPGRQYAVQRSSDLITWVTLQTKIAPAYGLVELEDATEQASAFYRTVEAP